MSLVYKSEKNRGLHWQKIFAEAIPDLPFYLWPEMGDPEQVEYLVAWEPPENFSELFPNLNVVFSVGAGIDQFDLASFPKNVKLVRMLDSNITQGIVEYVTLAALTLHRNLPQYLRQQENKEWNYLSWIPAQQRRVGVMGLGSLGQAAAQQLASLGFAVRGWSRTEKKLANVKCFFGSSGLTNFLAETDILICLLPLTDDTREILSAKNFALLPKGASIINVGRGAHLNENDLLVALESGQISSAILDVLIVEPADKDHPFWQHPNIILTPHIAGVTSNENAGNMLLANVRRHKIGEPMEGEVDLQAGY